jgi:hypothetical protein
VHRHAAEIAIFSGMLDASANLFYVLATRAGLFGVTIVLTSLYPGITVRPGARSSGRTNPGEGEG